MPSVVYLIAAFRFWVKVAFASPVFKKESVSVFIAFSKVTSVPFTFSTSRVFAAAPVLNELL